MKKTVFLLLSIMFFIGCSPLKMVTEIKYEEPIEMPDKSKSELYGMSNEWMVKTFTDARSIIQFSNLETGTISGKYIMYYSPPGQYSSEIAFYSIITIRIKDGKAQLTVDPQGILPRYMGIEMFTMEQMKKEAESLISDYKDFMKTYQKF